MNPVHKLISPELSNQIEDMVVKIKEFFGFSISRVNASKIIAWKAKCYNVTLTEKKLVEILGGKV